MADDLVARLRATGQSAFSRAMRGAAGDVDRVGDRARRGAGGLRLFAAATTSTTRGLRLMSGAAITGAAAGGVALGLFAKRAIDAASDVNESTSKNQVLFGRYAGTIESFAATSAKSMGTSRAQVLESTGVFGNLFRALDIGPQRAAGMSVSLTKLAGDLASFNNATPEDALEAIRSGLVGETEPLRAFGVNLSDDALRAEALRKGLVKTTKNALTPQQKALAVNSLLFKQTTAAQGDFERTSGGLANQQRILKAQMDDVTASLGTAFLPLALRVVSALNRDVVPAFGHVASAIKGIWSEDDHRSFAEKMQATGASARHWLIDPLSDAASTFWRDNREAIIAGAESAVSSAGSRMADAAAAAAPHAASAFVNAFRNASPWGKIITVGLLASKLGAFRTLGGMACGTFAGRFTQCLPGKMNAGITAGQGRFGAIGKTIAGLMWPVALALLTKEMVDYFTRGKPPAESANPEDVKAHHRIKPGEGPTGAEIAARRLPRDPGASPGGGQLAPVPIAPLPGSGGHGRGARFGPAAAASTMQPPRFPGLHLEVPVKIHDREIGRAVARIAGDDLAGM